MVGRNWICIDSVNIVFAQSSELQPMAPRQVAITAIKNAPFDDPKLRRRLLSGFEQLETRVGGRLDPCLPSRPGVGSLAKRQITMADLALHDHGAQTKKRHQTNYECSLGFFKPKRLSSSVR
jgi:hypothetical protein